MVAERIKRLMLLIVVLVPIVFGGLATFEHYEIAYWQKSFRLKTDEYYKHLEDCKSVEIHQLTTCDWGIEIRKEGVEISREALSSHGEKFQLYSDVAIYVPLATLALYFAVMWIWFGKVPNFKEHNINLTEIKQAAYKHRVTLGYCALAVVGLFVSMAFWENKYVQNMAIGGGVGVAVGLVVAVIKLLFKKK